MPLILAQEMEAEGQKFKVILFDICLNSKTEANLGYLRSHLNKQNKTTNKIKQRIFHLVNLG